MRAVGHFKTKSGCQNPLDWAQTVLTQISLALDQYKYLPWGMLKGTLRNGQNKIGGSEEIYGWFIIPTTSHTSVWCSES